MRTRTIGTATEVVNTPNDAPELLPMLDAVKANTGQRPDMVFAYNGYLSEADLRRCRRRQRRLVAVGRETKKPTRWPTGTWTQRMHRTLRLPWARALYDHRKNQGERPFAEIKATMGFRRFAPRGLSNVDGERNLVCAAFTLKRMVMAEAGTL